MRSVSPLVLVALALATNPAQAGWTSLSSGGPYLLDVSQPTDTDLFAIGMSLDQTGYIPKVVPHVYASADGGRTMSDITNGFGGLSNTTPTAVQFLDAQRGYIAAGQRLLSTTNRGATWTTIDLGFAVNGVAMLSATDGFVVGADGMIQRLQPNGTFLRVPCPITTDLMKIKFVDAEHGYIAAYNMVESTDPYDGSVTKSYVSAQILRTDDGGYSWQAGQVFGDYAVEEMFFLADGRSGFISAYNWVDADHNKATMFKTTDGGNTVVDMAVPVQVGTLQMGMSNPINVDRFLAVYFTANGYGRLGGTAFIAKSSDAKAYRNVDFFTADGGASWSKTDLGTIQLSMTGEGQIESDGGLWGGLMRTLYDGRMVGENRKVVGYSQPCNGPGTCIAGYLCDESSQCVPDLPTDDCVPACDDQSVCVDHTCVPVGGDTDAPQTGGDSDNGSSFKFGNGGDSSGCTTVPGLPLAVLTMMALLAMRRRDR